MADRTFKSDDTNDLVLQNNDGSAKLELNEDQTVKVTTGSDAGEDFTVNTSQLVVEGDTGNIGIGLTTPSQALHVDGNIRASGDFFGDTDTSIGNNQGESTEYSETDNAVKIFTLGTERLRIDSSGHLLHDTTVYLNASAPQNSSSSADAGTVIEAGGTVQIGRHQNSPLRLNRMSNNGAIAEFRKNGTTVGTVSVTSSSTSYNTSSDYRLKEDWQPMSGSIDRLKALNPVNFAWKRDGIRVDGFLAHEAAVVIPEAVSGEKDAVEAIGNVTDAEGTVVQENVLEPEELSEGQTWTKTEDRPVYQGIDQAKLVPLLTAALQEAVSKIEALTARIEVLENAAG